MQTLKINVEDSILDKIIWLLSNVEGVKIKRVESEDVAEIGYVDEDEEEEILQKLNQISSSEKEIDTKSTTIVSI